MSRESTMTDLFRRLLVTSDPWLSSVRQSERRELQRRRHGPLSVEVRALLENQHESDDAQVDEDTDED